MVRIASLTLLLLIPILVACGGDPSASLEERTQYWQQRLNDEVPPGSPQSQLLQWLDGEGIDYSVTRADGEIVTGVANSVVFTLEKIESDDWVCDFWIITGRALLEGEAVERYDVSRQGACL